MFVGLLGSLWVWKCMMMVVFQNKIIYMPGLPPNARRERIEDYARQCGGISWQARRIRAADAPVYILYFQGNASSLPPRLQDLSWVLRALQGSSQPAHYTMVCLSYRGYWTSRGRPSEKGINLDAQAALRFVGQIHAEAYGEDGPKPLIIFWGQSIGSGVATNLAAWENCPRSLKPGALVLETPFTSIRAMLLALYPPKWVPYRYLWPFLRNHLDSLKNFEMIAARRGDTTGEPYITLVEGGRDELVPAEHGAQLQQRCVELGLPVEKKTVQGAFHNDVMFRAEGRKAVAEAIERAVVARAQVRDKA
ncbi:Lysophosphatidylserine lipase ABHD12 like protein [Verticillium longisporum]|uniref:Lysophosphatidylserine lipase ABHD12 like protein n=1 Tax=Verticillium longisporum TaxID=100787 RepID=A0A8I2ZF80_VERLO|nr:Lysophosphatidylserine lipase ABHD12 like protein [Verticillium longisporum]KAG7129857.1 Lysophosphatidylserine lipase ABHD12 like protein [Verticillium longisporum]